VFDTRLLKRLFPPLWCLWPAVMPRVLVRAWGRTREERAAQAPRVLEDDRTL